jgi:hypothetical protein
MMKLPRQGVHPTRSGRASGRSFAWGPRCLALVAYACVASGCPRDTTTDTPDASSSSTAKSTAAAATPQSCGTEGLTLTPTSLVPHDARSVVIFDLRDPELDAALPHLTRATSAPPLDETRLPVVVASDLAQWSFEVRALSMHLATVGLRPRHVVRTLSPSGAGVWVVPSDCDLTELRTRALRSWKFLLRQSAEGWVGVPGEDSSSLWGVVVLPDDRLAFVPRTGFASGRAWIAAHAITDATYSAALWSLPGAAVGAERARVSPPRPPRSPLPATRRRRRTLCPRIPIRSSRCSSSSRPTASRRPPPREPSVRAGTRSRDAAPRPSCAATVPP